MIFNMENLAQTTILLTFVGTLFNFFILKPLRLAIDDLRNMIADVRLKTDEDRRERHMIEIQLARVEDSAKSAHHRIDTLEQRG